tara:strand:- start:193 stop:681 length:489 start_codon:yes stop_codon:yes gene_type:complete
MAQIYRQYNIYTSTATTTEVVLIDQDIVENPTYGHSTVNLIINTINIANTHAANTATIDVYLKYSDYKATGALYEGRETFTGADSSKRGGVYGTVASPYAASDEIPDQITYYYIMKNIKIPVGVTLQLDDQLFKDIDFKYYDLCAVADGDTTADIIINFKNK